jgi:hypothetical protein
LPATDRSLPRARRHTYKRKSAVLARANKQFFFQRRSGLVPKGEFERLKTRRTAAANRADRRIATAARVDHGWRIESSSPRLMGAMARQAVWLLFRARA